MKQQYQCPNCSAPVASGVRFCSNCGTQLNWATQQQVQPPPQYNQYPYQHLMQNKGRKLNPDPKEFPPIVKRGICIFILELGIISITFEDLRSLFEKGMFKKKLPKEIRHRIIKEVASYFYYETVKQIVEYKEGNLSENDKHQFLNVIAYYYDKSYQIDIAGKLTEYNNAENPLYHVSRNIQEIVEHRDVKELFSIAITISAWLANPEYNLFDCIRKTFKLSDAEVNEIIDDFYKNIDPKLIKQESF